MASKLTDEAISTIESNIELFARVARELGVKPTSLPMILKRNSRRLLEFDVLILIAKAMNKKPAEIIEHITTTKATNP